MRRHYAQTSRARHQIQMLGMKPLTEPEEGISKLMPDHPALVVRSHENNLTADWMQWGMIPRSYRGKLKPISINVETLHQKSEFREAWKIRRCLIPIDGWFEGRRSESPEPSQMFYFSREDKEPLLVGGLWFRDTFALLTTLCTNELSSFITRLPFIVCPTNARTWLHLATPIKQLTTLSLSGDDITAESYDGSVLKQEITQA